MDQSQIVQNIEEMERTNWWKLYIKEVDKQYEELGKELLRDWWSSHDILNDKLSERIYTYYDVMALLRNHIKKFKHIPEHLKQEKIVVTDMSDRL